MSDFMRTTFPHTLVAFDLDDTLYKEIDYLRSAYREIAIHAAHGDGMLAGDLLSLMIHTYRNGGNAFRRLNEALNTDTPVDTYLRMYRLHRPDIHLSTEARGMLDELKTSGCTLALITDGRSVQQRNKIAALGLDRWITDGDIVISEEIGSEKPAADNYLRLMERHPACRNYVYVGDNPTKDFIAPNRLGWTTICILDNGENIHLQNFTKVESHCLPLYKVNRFEEVPKCIFLGTNAK